MRATTLLLAVTLLGAAAAPAAAQGPTVTLTFDTPIVTGVTPGSVVPFTGTIANVGALEAFLNGTSFSFLLAVDDAPFFLLAPSLLPGASTSGLVMNVTVAPGTTPGPYSGVFAVLGGVDPLGADLLAAAQFEVDVVAAQAVAPEPAPASLLGLGLAAVGGGVRLLRRRRTAG